MPAKIQIQKQREILLFLIKILSFENFFLFLDLVYYRCSCFILNTRLIMNKDLRKVVILLAHPNMKESQANKALIDAVSDIEGVAVFNLYDQQGASFDVDEWSKIISDASALIYQFPLDGCAVIAQKMAGRSIHLPFQDSGSSRETIDSSNHHRFRI